ncbi:hypothetical protein [Occallatibacter savannae]|uniref:hypothetical protein n=1 Tax=Occallatibacter savannae TaxID=1002691 RepID=UPI001EF67B18|nr:hypothetical protein [Occallatibacter savannae]
MSLKSIGFVLLAALGPVALSNNVAKAQDPAGVPPAIRSATKLFLSNAGAERGLFPKPFSGNPDRAYTQFYSALKAAGQAGRYEVVSDPSDAELVLELRLIAPAGPTNADKQKGASDPLPEFRLTIYDEKTHYILWTLNESIGVAALQRTHDRNFDEALTKLLVDFEQLTGKTAAAAGSRKN